MDKRAPWFGDADWWLPMTSYDPDVCEMDRWKCTPPQRMHNADGWVMWGRRERDGVIAKVEYPRWHGPPDGWWVGAMAVEAMAADRRAYVDARHGVSRIAQVEIGPVWSGYIR